MAHYVVSLTRDPYDGSPDRYLGGINWGDKPDWDVEVRIVDRVEDAQRLPTHLAAFQASNDFDRAMVEVRRHHHTGYLAGPKLVGD